MLPSNLLERLSELIINENIKEYENELFTLLTKIVGEDIELPTMFLNAFTTAYEKVEDKEEYINILHKLILKYDM